MADEIYERAEELVAQDHVSVDRFVAGVVNEHLSEWARAKQRASQGSLERLKRVLTKVLDVPAEATDQI